MIDPDMDSALETLSSALAEDMDTEHVERSKLFAELIDRLCVDERFTVVALALVIALRHTMTEWDSDDEDEPPDDDPDGEPIPTEDKLKLVG